MCRANCCANFLCTFCVALCIAVLLSFGIHMFCFFLVMCVESSESIGRWVRGYCCFQECVLPYARRTSRTVKTVVKPVRNNVIAPSDIVMVRNPDGKLQMGTISMV